MFSYNMLLFLSWKIFPDNKSLEIDLLIFNDFSALLQSSKEILGNRSC